MGLIADLIEWSRTQDDDAEIAEARCDLGGDDLVTAPDYQPSGHDSQPLPGDFLLLVPGPEAGSWVVAGWLDPNNAGVAKPGETRLYARDSDGNVVSELHVTADGEVPDGIAEHLIARADRTDAALNALASTFNSHKHGYVGGGTASGPLSSTIPASDPAGAEPIEQVTDNATACDKVYIT